MKSLIWILVCVSSIWGSTIQKQEELHPVKKIGPRIIGGDAAEETEFPYMAAIWSTTSLGRYFCGGAIIDRRWILTAGHCVLDAVSFSIQLGSVNLTAPDVNRRTITATISVVHPDFNPETLANNVGLIQLDQDLTYNDYVNVIALPVEPLADNTLSTTIGWGQIDDDHSGPVETLRKVLVSTVTNDHCRNTYGNQITDNMVCALGAYNEGTCIGDIGSPLIVREGEQPYHVGVASFLSGNGCESIDPSGYERTYAFLNWIQETTGIGA